MKTVHAPGSLEGYAAQALDLAQGSPFAAYVLGVAALLAFTYHLSR